MGRKLRMVPEGWQHPKTDKGAYIPLFEPDKPLEEMQVEYDRDVALWDAGKHQYQRKYDVPKGKYTYHEFMGGPGRPSLETHTPFWPAEERTHLQMYENTSEGTPISPVMKGPEELATWLANSNASAFGSFTMSRAEWLESSIATLQWYKEG